MGFIDTSKFTMFVCVKMTMLVGFKLFTYYSVNVLYIIIILLNRNLFV